MVNVAALPAETDCDVGLADKENSELLPPPPEPLTVRRGEITQPFATRNRVANNSANLRMTPLFRRCSLTIRFRREAFRPETRLCRSLCPEARWRVETVKIISLDYREQPRCLLQGGKNMVKS